MRVQPQSLEAEKSILGAMLLDKTALTEGMRMLAEDDFYFDKHKEIYTAIVNLNNNNNAVDVITVSEIVHCSDLTYLAELTDIPTTANAKHYARIVKAKSIRRQYIKASQDIMEMAYNGEYDNVIDFKNDCMQKIDIEIQDSARKESDLKAIGIKVYDNIEKRYKDTESKLMYGMYWLDKKTGGAHKTDLTILAARPSVGKTAFALQIAQNIAKKDNNVAIFSLEMSNEQLVERMMTNYAHINSQKLRYPKSMSQKDWEILGQASSMFDYPIQLFDISFRIEEIRSICRELKMKSKLDFVIVDYLQLCETIKRCGSANERVSHITRQFKMLAKELGVPVWVLSQLTRANEHDNRQPKLSDLRDSGSIEQDADNVFFLYDENYGKYTEKEDATPADIQFIIGKQRNGGRDIMTTLKFYKGTQKFHDTIKS